MKKLIITLAAVLVSVSSFAQGTVIFNNRTQEGDAPISRPNGTGAGVGVTAQLYLVTGSGASATFTPLTPTTTFRTGSAAAAFFVNSIDEFVVNGVLPGQNATLRLRAWETAAGSYETAATGAGGFLSGQSNDVLLQLGGQPAVGAPIPTPSMNGLQGFTLQIVPEPSTMALGLLGAAALLFRRRK